MYTKEIGIRDIYKHYEAKCTDKPVDYKTATSIIRDFNKILRDKILNNETVKLPYNLGYLGITKFEVNYDPEKIHKWRIDFKATKEAGYKVFYGAEYGYRWLWFKGVLSGRRFYQFKPCRFASRSIAAKVREGIDYYKLNKEDFQ